MANDCGSYFPANASSKNRSCSRTASKSRRTPLFPRRSTAGVARFSREWTMLLGINSKPAPVFAPQTAATTATAPAALGAK
jgi:hypothetical protein